MLQRLQRGAPPTASGAGAIIGAVIGTVIHVIIIAVITGLGPLREPISTDRQRPGRTKTDAAVADARVTAVAGRRADGRHVVT